MSRSKARAAVVGVGRWGKNIARVLYELENCELVAVCDVDRAKARALGDLYATRSYANLDQMLEEVEVDAVVVATPTPTHYDVALRVIQAEKHVFVEKPFCDSSEKAKKLIEEASKRRIKLMAGHIERFNPAIEELKKAIEEGKLGTIFLLSARRTSSPPRITEVGIVKDLAIHDIDVMNFLLGKDPTLAFARCEYARTSQFEDSAEIVLFFEGGVTGYIEASWLSPTKDRKLTVVGDRAVAQVDYTGKTLFIVDQFGRKESPVKREEPLKLELSHFIDCVIYGKEPLVAGLDGFKALRIAEAALTSAREGKIVKIAY